MRNLWMLVSGLVLVVVVGGPVYYFFERQPGGNPLLTADEAQFWQWFPAYCGADMFIQPEPKAQDVDVCVRGIVSRVAEATGVKLTRADVLDPRVKAHWREVMGAK